MSIDIWNVSPLIVIGLAVLLVYLRRRGRSPGYLACVALFGIYLVLVAHWTIFPLILDEATLAALARERSLADAVELLPIVGGLAPTRYELVGNILLGVPFGFGLPFVSSRRGWDVLIDGLVFAVAIEIIQLLIDLAYGFGYRVIDVNDIILVWLGVLGGYIAFRVLSAAYRRAGRTAGIDEVAWGHAHDVLMQ